MKVESSETRYYEYVVIDGQQYRRHSADWWEVVVGNDWEPEYDYDGKIEKAYQLWSRGLQEEEECCEDY